MNRLASALPGYGGDSAFTMKSWPGLPASWPTHQQKPYAFKAYALQEVSKTHDVLLWADACMLPVRSMEPLWERIEREGYVICRNGWMNDFWTAESAYDELFPVNTLENAKIENAAIPHVVATCFGLNAKHPCGAYILEEYFRLASTTNAFCGPWTGGVGVQHRHDQTALSVIAWRAQCELTECPDIFAYGKEGEATDPRTIMLADGAY